jgi:hypothetical protein
MACLCSALVTQLISGGTNSNTPSTQIDLNETSLEAAVIQIAAWTDERGLLIAAKPKKMVVPPHLMFVAKRLLTLNCVFQLLITTSTPSSKWAQSLKATLSTLLDRHQRLVPDHRRA